MTSKVIPIRAENLEKKQKISQKDKKIEPNQLSGSFNFIDLFAGAGGLSCGLEQAGHQCLLGIDFDKNAMATFQHNHPNAASYCGPIEKLSSQKLLDLVQNRPVHLIVGGPPCQGFSTVGRGNPEDGRNGLFKEYIRAVKTFLPYFIVLENVTGLLAKKNEDTLTDIFKYFRKIGYHLKAQILRSEEFGVPEKRRRTILVGTRFEDFEFTFPIGKYADSPPVNVALALGELETKKGEIFNHDLKNSAPRSDIDLKRLKKVPEGKSIRYERDEKAYFTPSLRLGIDWTALPENRLRQAKYQRLDGKLPSPTIMTNRYSYFHPKENRYLTAREAAKLQSFPNDFQFFGSISAQWRQIGNAVPPLMAKAIGTQLKLLYARYLKEKGLNCSIAAPQKRPKKVLKQAQLLSNIREIRSEAFVYKRKEKRALQKQKDH